jgi:hypothetical protein
MLPSSAGPGCDRGEVEGADLVPPSAADAPVFGAAKAFAALHAPDAGSAIARAGAGWNGSEEDLCPGAAEGGVFADADGEEREADYCGDVQVGRKRQSAAIVAASFINVAAMRDGDDADNAR